MAPKIHPDPKRTPPAQPRSSLDKPLLRQSLDLFLFSAAFALLFNLFYVEGIELKVRPKPEAKNKDPHSIAPTPSYPGLIPSSTQAAPLDPASSFPRVSLMGAKDRFDSKSAVFLDARPAEEYKEAHIPGALNFYADEFDRFAPLVLPKLPDPEKELVAYCHGVSCELSLHLAKRLKDLGYRNVKVFFGGWPEWKKAGYPTSSGETP